MPSSIADRAELEQLLQEHRPTLTAVVERRLDPKLALRVLPEDVVDRAFAKARRRWDDFTAQGRMRPYPWLYRLVRDSLSEAWDWATRDCRDVRRDLPWPADSSVQLALGLIHPGTSPSSAAAGEELREQVLQALGLLKPTDREILWMRHFDQLTFGEIGQVLDLPENTANQRYVRALRRLKDLWLKLYPSFEGPP
jgi:RNA polymerase sigma-70 factor, ECF subfamily